MPRKSRFRTRNYTRAILARAVKKGKVYPQKDPRTLVRIVGQAPLAATVYELDRLRCNLCGEVFTAPEPEGIGPEKYDETTAAMIALLKYGTECRFIVWKSWNRHWVSHCPLRRSGRLWKTRRKSSKRRATN